MSGFGFELRNGATTSDRQWTTGADGRTPPIEATAGTYTITEVARPAWAAALVDGGPVTFPFEPDRSDQPSDIVYTNAVPPASIATTARDARDRDQLVELDVGDATIVDTVTYTSLVPGTEYVATGELMVLPTTAETPTDTLRADQTVASSTVPLASVIRSGITGSVSFVPDDPDGSIDVVFAVPADSPLLGHVVVVYQRLSIASSGRVVAVHADPDAAEQTIRFAAPPTPPPPPITVVPTVPTTVAPATTVAVVVAANPPPASPPPASPPPPVRLARTGTDGSRSIAGAGVAVLLFGSGLLLAVRGSSTRRRATSGGAASPSAP